MPYMKEHLEAGCYASMGMVALLIAGFHYGYVAIPVEPGERLKSHVLTAYSSGERCPATHHGTPSGSLGVEAE